MILVIDDEKNGLWAIVEEIYEQKEQIKFFENINLANTYLEGMTKEDIEETKMVILDIMMDTYENVLPDIDTARGTKTGFYFLEKVLKIIPREKVIVVTNYNVQNELEDMSRRTGVDYYFKRDINKTREIEKVLKKFL